MKNLSTWLLVFFMGMFLVFRIIVCLTASMGGTFLVEPLNVNLEVIVIFVDLAAMLFIIRRNMIGAIIYLTAHGLYFGTSALKCIMSILGGDGAALNNTMGALFSVVGIVLPLWALLDMFADKARKANPTNKKTDWFYTNEAFDRKLDERADKNNYKF